MGSHPINLLFRFLLELLALVAVAYWAYQQSEAWPGLVLAVLIPFGLAVIWGVFNVPADPSRSGNAPIAVSGIVRLLIEAVVVGMAIWSLYDSGLPRLSAIFGALVIIHYLISYDRVLWLLSTKN